MIRQFSAVDSAKTTLSDDLTQREVEVLKLIAEGLSNKQIGQQLNISEKTVKNHINNILSKLHLYDRTQATLFAIRSGLVKV
jgi:DNA-binding NarL/FixJ family response regulator